MTTKTTLVGTAMVLALAAAAATPANAVVTEFATFSALTTYNVYYKNPASGISGTGASTGNGKSASATFYTVASPTSTVAAPVNVNFSFINEGATLDNAVSNVVASFSLSGTTTGPAVLDSFSKNLEEFTSGTFSYKTTTAITVGTHHYAAGSVLLAGTFAQGVLAGKGSLAGLNADNDAAYPGDVLTFTSDFVTFQPTAALGLSYTLASIFPAPLSDAKVGTYALKTFKTDVGGQFTADPAPHVNAVPEPASWALMFVGFGIAGASVRSRRKVAA